MFEIQGEDGRIHRLNGQTSIANAMGVNQGKTVIMTDELGRVVGAGAGGENLMNSLPIIEAVRSAPIETISKEAQVVEKAMKTESPLMKSQTRVLFLKPSKVEAIKPKAEVLAKAEIAKIPTKDSVSIDLLSDFVDALMLRLSALEATISRLSEERIALLADTDK